MKQKTNFSKDVNIWLEFAEYDLKTAKWNYEGEIYTSSCYACQQSAEKALKTLILKQGKIVPKIHSLDRLLSKLKEMDIDIAGIMEVAQELDKYYISARYPGQYGGPEGLYTENDAKSAIKAAEEILTFVYSKK